MSKNQYNSVMKSAENFIEAFKDFRDKKIVLYGLGQYTATLLSMTDEFCFVGLLDGDIQNIGAEFYGLTVLSIEEAVEKADLIVINTSTFYWNIIYDRIKNVNIPVYYANGELAEEKNLGKGILSREEKDITSEKIRQLIDKSEVISFDLYDTLIMRTVCNPNDIFKLTELKLEKQTGRKIAYREMRSSAVAKLQDENYTLDDLYSKIKELYPDLDVSDIRALELDVEKCITVARKEMVELFNYARTVGKEVYILSDMYLPKSFIVSLLNQCDIDLAPENILISCEEKKNKFSGTLWSYYTENILHGKTALHIGDSMSADVEMARKYGIEAVKIPSASKMMEELLSTSIWGEITTIYASLTTGIIINELFNSPFAWQETEGKYTLKTCEKFGKAVFGNIILTYLLWIIKECKKRSIDRLFFLSRDGFFLERHYLYLVNQLQDNAAPKEKYLFTSRKAILSLMAGEDKEAFEALKTFSFKGSFKDYLKMRFNCDVNENDINSSKECMLPEAAEIVTEWMKPYTQMIMDKLRTHRNAYIEYLEQFFTTDSSAIVDICYTGTIQYWMSKALKKTVKGFYCVADISENNKFYTGTNMFPCFQKDKKAETSMIWKNHKIVESLLTAPYGMMNCMAESGEIISFDSGSNQKNFLERELINVGIKEFIGEYVVLLNGLEIASEDVEADTIVADKLFGTWFMGDKSYSESIKKCFWHEDGFINGNQEYSLF